MKVLLKGFHLNGNTIGFHPLTQRLELYTAEGFSLFFSLFEAKNCSRVLSAVISSTLYPFLHLSE